MRSASTILVTTLALTFASTAHAETVEVTLADDLDDILNGYCIDIAGGNENVDITRGLQGHTCYSYRGDLGTDQKFETEKFAENQLYMTDFDVCATLSSLDAGATIGLAACDGSDMQNFTFTGEGTITPVAAPTMCLTLASETRLGRGSQHQIKVMTLAACEDAQSAYQTWRVRSTDD
ncbi:ricin-type beta-trefoil lectin domain protein [Tabrizicola sp.]|uniref:ricin-type beta-trefoil lectin domain protein n=1 Tax=Tabrizicola sp. TaxID=2005166 RepID=UPI003F3CEA80